MKKLKRIVIKVGTEALVSDTGVLDQDIFNILALQMSILVRSGTEVALVTSGSIKAGKNRMAGSRFGPVDLEKKHWAGIGARHILNHWGDAFELNCREIGQIWVTYANWKDASEHDNIRQAIYSYFQNWIIPVVNENDVVSDQEIISMDEGLSENDRLARKVAEMIEADGVLFLTKAGGVYDSDPVRNQKAKRLETIDDELFASLTFASHSSENGRGGIGAKIKEALICSRKGMTAAIAGAERNVILKFVDGGTVGTMVIAKIKAQTV